VGLGVRSLTAPPAAIPPVKARLAGATFAASVAAAQAALKLASAAEVRALLAERFPPEDAA
jgi:phosphocarrier protein